MNRMPEPATFIRDGEGKRVRIPDWLQRLFSYDDTASRHPFTLAGAHAETAQKEEAQGPQAPDSRASASQTSASRASDSRASASQAAGERPADGQAEETTPVVRPVPLRDWMAQQESSQSAPASPMDASESPTAGSAAHAWPEKVPADLASCKAAIERTFHLPENKDIVLRSFRVGVEPGWDALAVFVDGLVDKSVINTHILQPLMLLSHLDEALGERRERIDVVREALLPGNQITQLDQWRDLVQGILAGNTAVLVDGSPAALAVETRGWEHRQVGLPQTETVVRGEHDAFTESFRANTGLVRSKLRSPDLVTEMMTVGTAASTDVAVMYVKGVVNPALVAEVKRRIQSIEVDYLPSSGVLEQFIEDQPRSLIPQVLATERPDRIAHMLMEGHVAIFVGHSPFVLAVPAVFFSLLHTAEDAYVRAPFGTFLRIIRWLALFAALLLPAFYISVANFHPEMIPTDLMLAIAASREQVPFPVIFEVLLMEFSIELIREAGIRIPSVIGPTIGIVGALIIGQAAVQAGIVSPILVIVIAVTALASFAIPNYALGFGVRVMRFAFLLAASLFGFYGIALLFCAMVAKLSVQKSFGVPILAPVAPKMDSAPDVFFRGAAYRMNQRPSYLQPQNDWRQAPVTRPWSDETKPRSRQGRSRRP